MSIKICVFGSGSKGNCTCVYNEQTKLLIDDGLSLPRIEKCLKVLSLDPASFTIIITHSHVDHVGGVANFVKKYDVPVYVSPLSYEAVRDKYGVSERNLHTFEGDFYLGDFTVSPFEVSHDVPCVGYSVMCDSKKITYATDLGVLPNAILNGFCDSDLVVLESNHDLDMLKNNDNYSFFLKQRILSSSGHLSNDASSDAVVKLIKSGVKQIILAHLSEENNLPELAFSTVRDKLVRNGINEDDIRIEVALQNSMTSLFEVV